MAEFLVIADDVTGANATGVLLSKKGFSTCTLLKKSAKIPDSECIIYPTDSRAVEPDEAYKRVAHALKLLKSKDIKLYAKRIDSTLRGNLGSEMDAFFDCLGEDYLAVCVPVFPESGRILVGGYLLVHGVPLSKTEVAKDPKMPIYHSDALKIIQSQTKRGVQGIGLDEIHSGIDCLSEEISRAYNSGKRILVFDSIDRADMDIVAEAIAKLELPIFTVDPGPFTALMAQKTFPKKKQEAGSRVLCLVGSVNGVASTQAYNLLDSIPNVHTFVNTRALLHDNESRKHEIDRVVDYMLEHRLEHHVLAVIGDGIDAHKRISLIDRSKAAGVSVEDLSALINNAFAEIALRILETDHTIRGIYSTGGDITAAIHEMAGTADLKLIDEVLPLAAFGQAEGGKLNNMYIVSKGGMVGDENAMTTCVQYLQQQLKTYE